MRKLSLASAALVALGISAPAVAADMPAKARPPAVAAFSWAGCYVGVNGGWVEGRHEIDLSPAGSYIGTLPAGDILRLTTSHVSRESGWQAGAQYGCNWQVWPGVVVGIDSDWQWSDHEQTITAPFGPVQGVAPQNFVYAPRVEHVSTRLESFGTTRLRGGWAVDRVFLYLTGGLAVASIRSDTAVVFGPGQALSNFQHFGSLSNRHYAVGPVVGAGLEWAFAPNWSVKAEYLYMYFGDYGYFSPLVAPVQLAGQGFAWRTDIETHVHVARIGLNYRIDLLGWLTGARAY